MRIRLKDNSYKHFFCILSFALALGIGHLEKVLLSVFFIWYVLLLLSQNNRSAVLYKRSQSIPLLIWGLLYAFYYIISGANVITSAIYYILGPVCFYLYANAIVNSLDDEKYIISLCIAIASGYFIHAVFNVLYSIQSGTFQYSSEYVLDIWSHELHNRTIIGMYLTPMVVCSIPVLFFRAHNINSVKRMGLVFCCVLADAISIYIGNRTLLVLTVVSLAVCVIQGIRIERKKIHLLLLCLFFIFFAWSLYLVDAFGIKEFMENSFLAKRTSVGLESSRWQLYSDTLRNILNYSLGFITTHGNNGLALSWAHNIWLDILIFSGYIPFVLFLIFTVRVIEVAISIQKLSASVFFRIFVLSITCGLLLNWAVEPILSANPYYFMQCCLIFALFERYASVLKKNRVEAR